MFKQLKIYYVLVALPFALLLIGSVLFLEAIKATILRNPHPQINYAIFAIVLSGGFFILLNSRRLVREARTLVDFTGAIRAKFDPARLEEKADRYTGDLASILQMIASSSGRSISHQEQAAIEHELANTRVRLNRRNALPQYLTGLLVGMGLLGTFIGLLATLNDISVLISSFADLDMNNVDPIQIFRIMIERMKAPMQSMGIAFSASMFGLLGSIVLGLMMVGIRRLQGDIFSLLSSGVARHIEVALSYEGKSSHVGGINTGEEYKVLVRIEERIAESIRQQKKAFSSEIDDLKTHHSDLLRAIVEQTDASASVRRELQQIGQQFGTLLQLLERTSHHTSSQISDLTVQAAADARESQRLLTVQLESHKNLFGLLQDCNIEEKLNEMACQQKRLLSAEMEDFQRQRSDMLHTLKEQIEASNLFRNELQKLNLQMTTFSHSFERNNGDILSHVSELNLNSVDEAKKCNKSLALLAELQEKMLEKIDSNQVENRIKELVLFHRQNSTLEVEQYKKHREDLLRGLGENVDSSNSIKSELHRLGDRFEAFFKLLEQKNTDTRDQISELMIHMTAETKEMQKLLSMQVNEQRRLRDSLGLRLKSSEPSAALAETGS